MTHPVNKSIRNGKIGKALGKVDGIVFGRQAGHDGKNGRSNMGQLRFQRAGIEVRHYSPHFNFYLI